MEKKQKRKRIVTTVTVDPDRKELAAQAGIKLSRAIDVGIDHLLSLSNPEIDKEEVEEKKREIRDRMEAKRFGRQLKMAMREIIGHYRKLFNQGLDPWREDDNFKDMVDLKSVMLDVPVDVLEYLTEQIMFNKIDIDSLDDYTREDLVNFGSH